MRFVRHALFAFCLLLAQVGVLAHAFEHLRDVDGGRHAAHTCALCLSAHGVDTQINGTSPLALASVARHELPRAAVFRAVDLAVFALPSRAPPLA